MDTANVMVAAGWWLDSIESLVDVKLFWVRKISSWNVPAKTGALAQQRAGSLRRKRVQLRGVEPFSASNGAAASSRERLVQRDLRLVWASVSQTIVISKVIVERSATEGFDCTGKPGRNFYRKLVTIFGVSLTSRSLGHVHPHPVRLSTLMQFLSYCGIWKVRGCGIFECFVDRVTQQGFIFEDVRGQFRDGVHRLL